jgi:hypothetical protein
MEVEFGTAKGENCRGGIRALARVEEFCVLSGAFSLGF